MSTAAEALAILAAASADAARRPGSDALTSWLGPLLRLGARMASAGLTPEHITRIDVDRLRELEADADSRLDARAERHDRGVPPSDRTPDRRATMPVACTGISAAWCPIHGDCTCGPNEMHEPALCDEHCALHSPTSTHGDAPASTDRAPSVYPEDP